MAKINLNIVLDQMLQYWKEQEIVTNGNSIEFINAFENKLKINLPNDFKEYFKTCNGMGDMYPNNTDKEGFLFYPLEYLTTCDVEFGTKSELCRRLNQNNESCIIFMNYLHKSWWYGILKKFDSNIDNYSIIIIPNQDKFKVIAQSLSEFIELYLQDSSKLYDHE